jgi:hypothetical protein
MSEESAKLRREIRELQDRSHSLIQKAKKLVEGSSEELQGDFDGPPRAPTRDYPISIIPSKTRSLSLPIADASVSPQKNQLQHGLCRSSHRHQRSSRRHLAG